eukprot:5205-Heterococcus_DN1.PRE.2
MLMLKHSALLYCSAYAEHCMQQCKCVFICRWPSAPRSDCKALLRTTTVGSTVQAHMHAGSDPPVMCTLRACTQY